MYRAILLAILLVPGFALAKDRFDDNPPKPTKTTKQCTSGQVWDSRSQRCVSTQSNLLSDDVLYDAVREFAYAGQLEHAQAALAAMSDQTDDRVLTYWGFTHRRLGDMEKGMAYYRQALEKNSANITTRSYMGQAFVELGDLVSARRELMAIRDLGGEGTWAEMSLARAIADGTTYNY